jgi:tRNA uridine 5-carbamoylmethylation protein Kti12
MKVIIVSGVNGCGKTTFCKTLADALRNQNICESCGGG